MQNSFLQTQLHCVPRIWGHVFVFALACRIELWSLFYSAFPQLQSNQVWQGQAKDFLSRWDWADSLSKALTHGLTGRTIQLVLLLQSVSTRKNTVSRISRRQKLSTEWPICWFVQDFSCWAPADGVSSCLYEGGSPIARKLGRPPLTCCKNLFSLANKRQSVTQKILWGRCVPKASVHFTTLKANIPSPWRAHFDPAQCRGYPQKEFTQAFCWSNPNQNGLLHPHKNSLRTLQVTNSSTHITVSITVRFQPSPIMSLTCNLIWTSDASDSWTDTRPGIPRSRSKPDYGSFYFPLKCQSDPPASIVVQQNVAAGMSTKRTVHSPEGKICVVQCWRHVRE